MTFLAVIEVCRLAAWSMQLLELDSADGVDDIPYQIFLDQIVVQ